MSCHGQNDDQSSVPYESTFRFKRPRMAIYINQAPTSKRGIREKPEVSSSASGSLILHPTHDGWRLVGAGGKILFESRGHGRRRPRLDVVNRGGDLGVVVRL
jgi:hypothetical protein